MAFVYPLSLTVFADQLGIASVRWRPGHQQEYSGLGSGSSIGADVAPALREADVSSAMMAHSDAARIMALIESLGGIISTFYMYDPRKLYPAADPDGTILGANVVTINALNANNKAMRLAGLTAGYVLTAGDFLSWDYGSSPVRRAYHRVLETVTADGTGLSPEFEVRDFIRTGSSTGLVVTLKKPAGKFKMVAGTLSDETVDAVNSRITFSIRQVL